MSKKSAGSQLFAISCWGMLSVGIVFSSLGPLLAPISDAFHLKLSQIALPVVSHSAGFFVGNVFVAFLWRIRRARLFLTASGLITFLMLVSISLFHTPELFFILLFFLGIVQGIMHTSLDSLFSEFSGEERARPLNWLHVFIGVGAVLGPLSVGAILTYSDKWYLVYVVMAIVALPLPILFSRPTLYSNIVRSGQTKTLNDDLPPKPTTSPLFWLAILGVFTYAGLEFSLISWTPIFLVKVRYTSYVLASYSISIFWLAMMMGRFFFGHFFHRTSLSLSLVFGAFAAALLTTLAFSIDHLILVGVFLALSGLSLSWFYPNILALGASGFPRYIGFMTGLLAAGGTMGSILFPWIIGPISEIVGLTRGVFFIPLLCLGLMAIFFYHSKLLKRKR